MSGHFLTFRKIEWNYCVVCGLVWKSNAVQSVERLLMFRLLVVTLITFVRSCTSVSGNWQLMDCFSRATASAAALHCPVCPHAWTANAAQKYFNFTRKYLKQRRKYLVKCNHWSTLNCGSEMRSFYSLEMFQRKVNPKEILGYFCDVGPWPYSHVILTPSGRLHCSCPAAAWSATPRRPPPPGQSWAPPPARTGSSHPPPPPATGTQSHRGRARQVRAWRILDWIFFEWILRLLCLIWLRWVWN